MERDVPAPAPAVRCSCASTPRRRIMATSPMIDGANPAGGSGEEAVAGFEYAGEIAATR
ncbi:hypothetical protein QJS66_12955 [Kocuria rhizophila]|nr:hypothetical protein QJS66_12955 [Kocuria rhizophila]